MWMLNLIPNDYIAAIVHIVFFASLIGYLGSRWLNLIPPLAAYVTPIKNALLVVFLGSVYFEGVVHTESKWKDKLAVVEDKLRIAEAKSNSANVVIETKYVDRIKKVKEVQIQVVEKIKEVEKVIDAKCEIDPSVISILNEAAKGPAE